MYCTDCDTLVLRLVCLLLLRRKATEETPACYAPTCLLDIPDPCLLTVLQHVAATHQGTGKPQSARNTAVFAFSCMVVQDSYEPVTVTV
jgi:hypothetical protein